MPHPSITFHHNLLRTFWVILQTNKQTWVKTCCKSKHRLKLGSSVCPISKMLLVAHFKLVFSDTNGSAFMYKSVSCACGSQYIRRKSYWTTSCAPWDNLLINEKPLRGSCLSPLCWFPHRKSICVISTADKSLPPQGFISQSPLCQIFHAVCGKRAMATVKGWGDASSQHLWRLRWFYISGANDKKTTGSFLVMFKRTPHSFSPYLAADSEPLACAVPR